MRYRVSPYWFASVLGSLLVVLALGGPCSRVAALLDDATSVSTAEITPSFSLVLLSGEQQRPALAYNPTRDSYLLVWESANQQGGSAIGTRLVSSDGATLGTVRMLTVEDGAAYRPDVVYNPVADEYLVVWHEYVNSGPADILGQRLAPTGALRGERIVISGATKSQQTPSVTCNPTTGMYFVAWTDLRLWDLDCYSAPYAADNACANIYGVRVGANGVPILPEIPLSLDLGNQFRVRATSNPAGDRFLVAWASYVDSFDRGDIAVRWVGGNGQLRGVAVTLPGLPTKDGPALSLAGRANVNMLAWHDLRVGDEGDIYASIVQTEGGVSTEIPVERAMPDQRETAVASDDENSFLVVWQDKRNAGDAPEPKPHDVYARCIGLDGTRGTSWAIYRGEGDQSYPEVAFASVAGTYLVAWQDNRDGAYGIYGAILDGCDAPVVPEATIWLPHTTR